MPGLVRYNPQRTRQFIEKNGTKVRWEKGVRCPCLTDYDRPSIECQACRGWGYAYPDAPKLIKGLVTGMSGNEQLVAAGLADIGMLNFTPQAGVRLDDGDRITILENVRRESEVIERGEEDRERLFQIEPFKILGVYRIKTGATGANALDALPADSHKLEAGHVVWIPGKPSPGHGAKYSVLYEYRPKYLVFRQEQPKYRGVQGQVLPQAVILRFMTPWAPGKEGTT